MTTELEKLLELARHKIVTPEERAAQRLSFAYGNAKLTEARVTRETIERASIHLEKQPVPVLEKK